MSCDGKHDLRGEYMCCTKLLSGQNSSEIMEGGYKTKKGSFAAHEKQLLITSQIHHNTSFAHL